MNSTGEFTHAETVITRIVLPNCVWRNGRYVTLDGVIVPAHDTQSDTQ